MSEVGSTSRTAPSGQLDPEEFATWYRSVLPRVYGYLFKATGGDRERTETLTQETFLQAVRSIQRDGIDAVSIPWLMTVARSRMIDAARADHRAERNLELVHRAAPDPSIGGIELTDLHARELLGSLRPLERAAVALRYLDDLPVADVAEAIGRSVRATESILARARTRLRRHLEGMSDV